MDTLIGGFANKLQTAHSLWKEEAQEWPLSPIVTDYSAMMASLVRLFEVRHVLTHEPPSGTVFNSEELQDFIDAVRKFVEATDWSVIGVLRGSVPRRQLVMNMTAGDEPRREE